MFHLQRQSRGFEGLEPPLGMVLVGHCPPSPEKPRILTFSGPAALAAEDQWGT